MPLETLSNCPVCLHPKSSNQLIVEDHTVSHENFSIQKCDNCGFLYTNPRPNESSIGPYYESNEYISHHDDTPTLMSRVYKTVRDFTIAKKIKLINSLSPTKRNLLDIGCGTGVFIKACQENGWHVTATEPDSEARKIATQRTKHSVAASIFESELKSHSFNIITLWHVLEHVHKLEETITWLASHLEVDGKIIIAVPNHQSYDAKKYERFWAAYDVPRHLYHFNKDTMQRLLYKHGLSITSIEPMWFDSFYVSMLSTKYRSKGVEFIDSVITGLISNWTGRKTKIRPYNTSSLIYIISKV